MRRGHRSAIVLVGVIAVTVAGGGAVGDAQRPSRGRGPAPVESVRLYVLDGGVLESDPGRYRLKPDEVARTELSVAAYLVVHPKGTLMWDTGAIADDSWTPGGRGVRRHLVLSNGQDRYVTIRTPLGVQLAASGYAPRDVTYLAFSHYHWDHVANANLFAASTWLVRQAERDGMFPASTPIPPYPSMYGYLQNSKTTIIAADAHDVFGDGTVVIRSAPGHTPGHQVLALTLAKTGALVLSGDLYHYPEERTLRRLPVADFDEEQTRRSREVLDTWMAQAGARLWIQHDLVAHTKLRKAPQYYD
jgi:glyoxylase-like metal-dependent hydrolase (beta-lactamase superfamily II)